MRRSRPFSCPCTPTLISSLDTRPNGRSTLLPILSHGVHTAGISIRLQSTAAVIASRQALVNLSSSMGLCPDGRFGFLDQNNWGDLSDAQKQPWADAAGLFNGSLRVARDDAAQWASGINEFTTGMADLVTAFAMGMFGS